MQGRSSNNHKMKDKNTLIFDTKSERNTCGITIIK